MQIQELYKLLYSRIFYNLADASRIRFNNQVVFIDRRAGVPFSLKNEEDVVYLEMPLYNKEPSLLRVVTDHPDGSPLHLYEKESNVELLVLD
ncbi:hypothetical protein MKQ68_07540 [Chitinophaga horti]|uniref:Uncharacterized protein n=1 Tax=Chitinophaga horti TaxID=2920382 RepID=A0ABY6J618_9BACT|nr:hypothetical protein [Chitinophaga horti]UYQ94945.1 hypothetical protein MKQ68_07540 [Chitinophaga horti]